MKSSEDQRFRTLGRTLRLVGDLLRGDTHDRHSAAEAIKVQPAAASRILNAIKDHLPGAKRRRIGRKHVFTITPPRAAGVLTPAVATAACFGAAIASLFEGSKYANDMRKAIDYVVKSARTTSRFEDADRKFFFVRRGGEAALPSRAGSLDDLISAIFDESEVTLKYTHFDGRPEESLRVQPLSIAIYDHQLYLIAREAGKPPRPYRFSRLRDVTIEDESFEYPGRGEYDPLTLFSESFGIFLDRGNPVEDVELRLAARWKVFAESHLWHPSQQIRQEGGQVIVGMKVRLCPELTSWILSFGDEAEVMRPADLADHVRTIRRRAAALP